MRTPCDQRNAALDAAAVGDAVLAAEVRSLLQHDRTGLTGPVFAAAEPPARIGPYRVLERIGQGSSGQVYLAEQDLPVRRRVALKIVPEAARSPELAARFEVERRALECTDHPGIARILDAGRTSEGLPFLVMDYIEGLSITAHCERAQLGLDERIELVLAVAAAVQHAHQRGVIHRDLKPANVLVAREGGQPCVVDFGIAKAFAGRFGLEAPRTLGAPLGTPSYMAPEQTRIGDVDTRADVYALGAVLYELAAGQPPIDGSGDLLEVIERIRNHVPLAASRARLMSGQRPWRARCTLRDLDCILGRALEKSPERRYPSVGALSEDLRRLQQHEPIAARAPTVFYRAARFVRRNRLLVAAVVAVAFTLALGAVGLALGLLEARQQRATALEQIAAQAETNRFLTEDLLLAAAPERAGPDATVLTVLNAASAIIEARFPTRPLVAAAVHHALGVAYATLGEFDRADTHLARALALRRAVGASDSPETVRSEIAAASLLARREDAGARRALEAVVARARRVLGAEDRDLYMALNDFGVALAGAAECDQAKRALEEALAGRRRLLGESHPEVIETMGNLAMVLGEQGRIDAGLQLELAALDIAESLSPRPRMTLLSLCNNIGATYQDLDRDAEAAPYLRKAAAIADELLGPEHPATLTIHNNLAGLEAEFGDPVRAAAMFQTLAEVRARTLGPHASDTLIATFGRWDSLVKAGQYPQAAAGFAQLLEDASALGPDSWLVPHTQSALARALLACDRAAQALPLAREAHARLLQLCGADHPRTRSASAVLAAVEAASVHR